MDGELAVQANMDTRQVTIQHRGALDLHPARLTVPVRWVKELAANLLLGELAKQRVEYDVAGAALPLQLQAKMAAAKNLLLEAEREARGELVFPSDAAVQALVDAHRRDPDDDLHIVSDL